MIFLFIGYVLPPPDFSGCGFLKVAQIPNFHCIYLTFAHDASQTQPSSDWCASAALSRPFVLRLRWEPLPNGDNKFELNHMLSKATGPRRIAQRKCVLKRSLSKILLQHEGSGFGVPEQGLNDSSSLLLTARFIANSDEIKLMSRNEKKYPEECRARDFSYFCFARSVCATADITGDVCI